MNIGDAENILVIRLSSLGDILLTTPLLRSLRELYPDKKIDFITRAEYADILKYNPYVNEIFLYKRDDNIELFGSLRQKKYDAVIDLQNNLRSRKLIKSVQASAVFRFDKRSFDKFLLVKFKINRLLNAPQIPVRYASAVPGLKLDDKGLDLFLPQSESKSLAEGNYIAFCPGSRHFTKMWPPEYFTELGKMINREGFTVVLSGGRSDREICRSLASEIPGSVDMSNDDELFKTAAILKQCRLAVCNDSGMMHTACAAGTPVIAIFGSTVREFGFTPYKNKNLILENNSLSCRPCSHIGREKCPLGHFKCMLDITPAAVLDNVKRMLDLS